MEYKFQEPEIGYNKLQTVDKFIFMKTFRGYKKYILIKTDVNGNECKNLMKVFWLTTNPKRYI